MQLKGLTPYLFYADVAAMLPWFERVFGFVERSRYADEQGIVRNAELVVGDTELWLDGDADYWKTRGGRPDQWIGVWVDDVDAMYERVRAAGVDVPPPEDRPFGVRELKVTDPEGYVWGFMRRLG